MNVRVEILFDPVDEDAWGAMESLGRGVTNDEHSVRVSELEDAPGWLTVAFTMPTEAHYKAVEKVAHAVDIYAWEGLDSTIYFPKSEAERARARVKAERRRANRRASNGGLT